MKIVYLTIILLLIILLCFSGCGEGVPSVSSSFSSIESSDISESVPEETPIESSIEATLGVVETTEITPEETTIETEREDISEPGEIEHQGRSIGRIVSSLSEFKEDLLQFGIATEKNAFNMEILDLIVKPDEEKLWYVDYEEDTMLGGTWWDWEFKLSWSIDDDFDYGSLISYNYRIKCYREKKAEYIVRTGYEPYDEANGIYKRDNPNGTIEYACAVNEYIIIQIRFDKYNKYDKDMDHNDVLDYTLKIKELLEDKYPTETQGAESSLLEQEGPPSTDQEPSADPLPNQSIEIHDVIIYGEMRAMAECNDEARVVQYIKSIADSGVQSKDDLISFVNLIESLPNIDILNGYLTLMCFSKSISEDTGMETDVVYITREDENGDWTRVEHVLSVDDVSKKISEEKDLTGKDNILKSPVKNSNGNLTLYIETRNPHPSGKGTMIQWIGEVDGIFTRIYYFTNNSDNVKAENIFSTFNTDRH